MLLLQDIHVEPLKKFEDNQEGQPFQNFGNSTNKDCNFDQKQCHGSHCEDVAFLTITIIVEFNQGALVKYQNFKREL